MDNINFELQNPIKGAVNINGKNDIIDINTLYLNAPSYKEKDITIILKKKFIEAIFAMTAVLPKESSSQEKSDEMDAKSIKVILFAAPNFDLVGFFKEFEKLLMKVCFKDEARTQAIKHIELEKLNESDFEELLAKYIEVFFITSWMKTLS